MNTVKTSELKELICSGKYIVTEVLGRHSQETDRREWWAGGTWLYPGDIMVIVSPSDDAPKS